MTRLRSCLASLLAASLLALSGCGMVQDTARELIAQTFGEPAAAEGDEAASGDPAASGGGGLSIAADDDSARALADDDEDSGEPGFYKIVEPNGTVRFTSSLGSLSPEQRARAERLAMAPSKPSASRPAPTLRKKIEQLAGGGDDDAPQPPAARARSGGGDVVLYTTSWCGWCDKTRKWLDAKGVDYVDKDIERDADAAAEMRRLAGGGAGVPVVVIDGEVIRGFNQSKMAELL